MEAQMRKRPQFFTTVYFSYERFGMDREAEVEVTFTCTGNELDIVSWEAIEANGDDVGTAMFDNMVHAATCEAADAIWSDYLAEQAEYIAAMQEAA
jgi:hypothetical protein